MSVVLRSGASVNKCGMWQSRAKYSISIDMVQYNTSDAGIELIKSIRVSRDATTKHTTMLEPAS